MDRNEPQSTNATLVPQPETSDEAPQSEQRPARPTIAQIAGFGVEMGIMAGLLEESEIAEPITDAQRSVIAEIIDGLRELSALSAEAFGVADPFSDDDKVTAIKPYDESDLEPEPETKPQGGA